MHPELTPAAALVRVPQAVLSHQSAALLHGLPLVGKVNELTLTVPRDHSRLELPGASVLRRPLADHDVLVRPDGVRLTTVERTVADLARTLPLAQAVAAADGALRARTADLASLQGRLRAERGNGSGACRQVAGLIDAACESVLESLVRVPLWTGPWPRPLTQFVVVDPRGRKGMRLDFAWPDLRLAIEADGFAFHSDRAAYRADRERLNTLASLGWVVLRFTYEDATQRPTYLVALVRECLRVARVDARRPSAA